MIHPLQSCCTVGIDIGTSGVRAVALDCRSGTICAESVRPVQVNTTVTDRADATEVTSDADQIVAATLEVLTDLPTVVASQVAAVGFSVQGEAFLPVDTAGRPAGPVRLSMDRSGADALPRVADRLGAARFQQITGQPLNAMFSVFKIGTDAAGRRDGIGYAGLGDHVLGRLGGEPITDWTQAARTGLFDVAHRTWSTTVAEAAGIADVLPRLAQPLAAGTPAGTLDAELAGRTGLPAGTRLVVGAHDQAAAFLGGDGAGTTGVLSLGTSECLTIGSSARLRLEGTGLACYPLRRGLWLTLAGTAAGGWGLQWLADLTGAREADRRRALLDEPAMQPGEVMVLPYFTGSGTLDNDPRARGAVTGLSLSTRPDQLVRAMFEASGYEAAKILGALADQVDVTELRAVGSGAINPRALQIRADAAGLPLTPCHPQAAARGAALLAATGIGVTVPADLTAPVRVYPDPQYAALHRQRRRTYRDLYTAMACLRRQSPHGAAASTDHEPEGPPR